VELVGSSEKSWADAAQTAVNEAIKTIRGVRGDMKDLTAKVDSKTGKILEYRVCVKLSFAVEREVEVSARVCFSIQTSTQ